MKIQKYKNMALELKVDRERRRERELTAFNCFNLFALGCCLRQPVFQKSGYLFGIPTMVYCKMVTSVFVRNISHVGSEVTMMRPTCRVWAMFICRSPRAGKGKPSEQFTFLKADAVRSLQADISHSVLSSVMVILERIFGMQYLWRMLCGTEK